MTNYIHVEVLDKSMNPEYIVAVPVFYSHLFQFIDGYYTTREVWHLTAIPGSFIVRKRQFENEKIGVGK